jgi:hypothetical protein
MPRVEPEQRPAIRTFQILILQKSDLQKLVLLPVAMMLFLWAASASSGLVLRAYPEQAAATR